MTKFHQIKSWGVLALQDTPWSNLEVSADQEARESPPTHVRDKCRLSSVQEQLDRRITSINTP